ncbi:unnamed protein product [Musa textilis]
MAFLLPLTDATSLPAAKAPIRRRTSSSSPDPGRSSRRSACARGGVKDEGKERVIRVSDPLRERGLPPPPLLSVPLIAGASSASPPSHSVTPQQQTDDGDERHSYYVNMGYAIRTLREDFPDTFQREPNFGIFRFVIQLVSWLLLSPTLNMADQPNPSRRKFGLVPPSKSKYVILGSKIQLDHRYDLPLPKLEPLMPYHATYLPVSRKINEQSWDRIWGGFINFPSIVALPHRMGSIRLAKLNSLCTSVAHEKGKKKIRLSISHIIENTFPTFWLDPFYLAALIEALMVPHGSSTQPFSYLYISSHLHALVNIFLLLSSRDDIVFKDPLNTFAGIDNYKRIFWALRLSGRIFFRAIWINIVSIWQPAENVIMIRWIVHGIPRVPWESQGRFDGTSEYKLDKNGKIYEHRVDNVAPNTPTKFQVLPVEELIQLLGCSYLLYGLLLFLLISVLPAASWGQERCVCWPVTSLLFSSLLLVALGMDSSAMSIESLDSTIRDRAFDLLSRGRTGVAYEVRLPSGLSGVRASVQRMRSGNLWSRGARFGSLHVPPRTMTVPFARRLVVVHQDLGNWSSSFFNAPGYSLLAPVVGCLAYDASGSTSNAPGKLELRVLGDPISIAFPRVTLPAGLNATIKCARLGPHGSVAQLADAASDNACAATRTGHFTVVVPSAAAGEASETTWRVWAVACGSGVVGLLLVGLVGMGIMRLTRNRKMEEMEQQAEEGEALGTTWAGRSKMPSAAMSRTAAVVEDGTAAP